MIFYSLISQNAPVLQCLQGGKISPATICILFSFSVGWHALFSICPAKWYVPVEGTDWSVWNFPITPNIILFDIRFKTIIRILILDRYCQASVSTPQVLNSFVVHKKYRRHKNGKYWKYEGRWNALMWLLQFRQSSRVVWKL